MRIERYGRFYEVWWDKSLRLWTVTEHDAEDNQIGEAEYAPDRDSALILVGSWSMRGLNVKERGA